MTGETVRIEVPLTQIRLATEDDTVAIESVGDDDDSVGFRWELSRADAIQLGRALIEEASGED